MATFNRDHSFGNHVIAGLDHPFSFLVCATAMIGFSDIWKGTLAIIGNIAVFCGISLLGMIGIGVFILGLSFWLKQVGAVTEALLFTDVFGFLSFTEAASVRLSHSQFPFSSLLGRARHARRLANARARVARFMFLDLDRRKHPPLAVELGKKDRKVGK